jgi:hypothetical protein
MLLKLLQAITSLTRGGAIKSLDDAYRLAQRELGDKFNQYKNQIKDAFDSGAKKQKSADVIPFKKKEGIESLSKGKVKEKGEVIEASFKPGKSKYSDKVIEESPSQKGIGALDESTPLMKRLEEGVKSLKDPENITTGLTRTMAREILMKRGIDLGKGMDPIEVFRKNFGQDVLGDVSNLADELIEMEQMGKTPKKLEDILEQEGMFDIKMRKEPPQGYTDEEMAEIMEAIEQEDVLLKFDPKDRKPNAAGGIMRTNLAMGNPLPEDPTKPVNPFAPKPTGPALPNKMASAPDPMDERNSMMEDLSRKYYNRPLKDLTPKEIEALEDAFDDLVGRKRKQAPSIKLAGGGLAYLMGM